jgi:RHS repeat-associated protein
VAKNVLKRDAVGHRVIREVYPCNSATLSKTEYFVYGNDGNLNYREAYNASGGLTEREAYVYVEGEPLAIVRTFGSPTGNFFLHNDHLGRPLAMTSAAGSIVWKREFEPFGKSLGARVSSVFEPGLRFPGQWEYSDSGSVTGGVDILSKINALEDNWNRTYAFRWGRYTQPDPFVPPSWQEPSVFQYASANPLRFTDPLGFFSIDSTCDCPARHGNVPEGVAKACSYLNKPACQDFVRRFTFLQREGPLDRCIRDRCANPKGPVLRCYDRTDACGQYFPSGDINLYLGGAGCPRQTGLGLGPTIFHETIHSCGLGVEPGSSSYRLVFRKIMEVCTGYRE